MKPERLKAWYLRAVRKGWKVNELMLKRLRAKGYLTEHLPFE